MIQEHGGNICGYDNILDFSANINPLGPPRSVISAYISAADELFRYPDPFCSGLRQRIAEHEKHPAEKIVCGNGAADLIYRMIHTFNPQSALLCRPCFGEYEKALSEVNGCITEFFLQEDNNFRTDLSLIDMIVPELDMVILCSPNNPTGQLIPPEILQKAAEKCRKNNIMLICDQCFMGFTGKSATHSLMNFMNENCIILNAFTKLYAMAGLRLGYILCGSLDTAEAVRKSGQFWSVSLPAQKAGIAALDQKDYVERTISLIHTERQFLTEELNSVGITIYPSDADFLLFKSDAELYERLLNEGILIRCCQSFKGLDKCFYRTAVRNHADNIKLINALRRILNG